jgi:hypothetical protein
MTHARVDVLVDVAGPDGWKLAATLHLPPAEGLRPDAPVLVAMPGAGYNRRRGREAAAVDVPVLVGMGERDFCQDPLRELAAFQSARDLAQFVVPRMAHMHNFAGTRALLWRRIDAFIAQVAALKSGL